jgi:hypothetical protein
LSIASYSKDNEHGHNDDNDDYYDDNNNDDDDNNNNDDNPALPITDYLYIVAIAGVVYAGKKLI